MQDSGGECREVRSQVDPCLFEQEEGERAHDLLVVHGDEILVDGEREKVKMETITPYEKVPPIS